MRCTEYIEPLCYKKAGRPTVRPDDDTLYDLMQCRSTSEIAKLYGVNPHTVLLWIRKAGFEPTLRRPCRRPSDEELLAYYRSHTAPETAEQYGVQPSTVYSWMNDYRKRQRECME